MLDGVQREGLSSKSEQGRSNKTWLGKNHALSDELKGRRVEMRPGERVVDRKIGRHPRRAPIRR